MHQVRRVGLRLAPQIDINDDGPQILQRRDQVGGQKRGLADPPLPGKKKSGAQ